MRYLKPMILMLAAAWVGAMRTATAATTVSLNPTADAFVSAANPANNYGGGGALSVAASGLPNGEFESVMRFDTSGAKTTLDAQYGAGQWTVQSVSLRLTSTAPNNAIFNPSAAGMFAASWIQNDSWVEGTGTPGAPTTTGITFNTLPSFLGPNDAALGSFAFAGGTSGSATYSLGLPANFMNDILAGDLVSMRLFAADSSVSYLFNSRNFGTVTSRPELSITVVPEPIAAVALSMVCVFGRRRLWQISKRPCLGRSAVSALGG